MFSLPDLHLVRPVCGQASADSHLHPEVRISRYSTGQWLAHQRRYCLVEVKGLGPFASCLQSRRST